ncbi:floricaula/leafy homolog [Zingiber officinale]|uniref:floricaula/leafy homolog n=1 Tax=Zingiber officinale TaxID=94328 RepID=UPI001C4BE975|nr:floricaula/leafy homolog [Zingiber officinale]
MDPGDAFSANVYKWDPRGAPPHPCRLIEPLPPLPPAASLPPPPPTAEAEDQRPRELGEVFSGYGVRYATVARIGELGFTASTLVGMTEAEVDDMMATLAHLFRWDLLLGERYGIKAALRAERRRLVSSRLLLQQHRGHHRLDDVGRRLLFLSDHQLQGNSIALDALSQEGLSEEPVQHEKEAAGSGGETAAGVAKKDAKGKDNKKKSSGRKKKRSFQEGVEEEEDEDDEEEEDEEEWGSGSETSGKSRRAERQREHPFIVTEPGEVARAKKNGLDYLFHLYDQCRHFLLQVQALARQHGHKCPTKVTNQVFRYAKKVGASYINKPKMRHYVHCYALHCLDEEASNALRRSFKERGENVGAWRQACYKPLVAISARHGWDIDAVFNAHPRLSIWYVPTKLRQLCHLARSNAAASASSVDGLQAAPPPLMF